MTAHSLHKRPIFQALLFLCLSLPALVFTSSCSMKYDPLFDLTTRDQFTQPLPGEEQLMVYKETNKYTWALKIDPVALPALRDNATTMPGVMIVLRRPGWTADFKPKVTDRHNFLSLSDRFTMKFAALARPAGLSIVTEERYRPELDALKPVYDINWRVTRLRKGWGILRLLIGFGISPVRATIEGEINDPEGMEIGTFRIDGREAGLPMGAYNFRVLSWKYCATLMTPAVGRSVAEMILWTAGKEQVLTDNEMLSLNKD